MRGIEHLTAVMKQTTITCQFCGELYAEGWDDVDPRNEGFWCSYCDGYTFFDPAAKYPQFHLILEDSSSHNGGLMKAPEIKLNKRLSPLRYPGGKSKIADYILTKVNPEKTEMLWSPYSGGASVELALLYSGAVKQLTINDYDFGIYALFKIIQDFPDALTLEIQNYKPTHNDFLEARQIIKSGYQKCDLFEAAWSMLIVNRLAFSGIYKANPLGGLHGDQSKLLSRWNPEDLCRRINRIHEMSHLITVTNIDALELIEEAFWNEKSTIFIDPPYFKQGKHLYRYYYDEGDHINLQFLLDELHKGFPCADIILCYDDCEFIESIYQYPKIERIKRKFSA